MHTFCRLLSGLYLPAMPFSWQMWLGVFVSMVIGTAALIFVECFLYQRNVGRGNAVTAAVCSLRGCDEIVKKSLFFPLCMFGFCASDGLQDYVQPGEIAFQMCAMYLFQGSNMM